MKEGLSPRKEHCPQARDENGKIDTCAIQMHNLHIPYHKNESNKGESISRNWR